MKFSGLHRYQLLASLLLVAVANRLVPALRAEEPQWFKLNGLPEASVAMEVEGSTEKSTVGGVDSTYEHLFLTPLVGLRGAGSIYHPNLLSFDAEGELGWGWDDTTSKSTGFNRSRNESSELNRYLVQLYLLKAKPYNASFFATQDHTFRDYGTFDTFTVDSQRYGGRAGWNTRNLMLNTDFGYRNEQTSGLTDSTDVTELYLNFLGIYRRDSGQTTVNFRVNQFENSLTSGSRLDSLSESAGISDAETFGHRKQITAATGASYGHAEYSGKTTQTVNANENITVNHRPRLDSFLNFNYTFNQLLPVTDNRVQGICGIRHQLYESLTSTADVHGSYQDNSGGGNSSTTDRYGLGLSENYTKRLQSWGRLSIGLGAVMDHEDDHSAGSLFTTIGESHQLYLPGSPGYHPVYLSQPRVVAAGVQVLVGSELLVEGSDYELVPSGELTEVRLISPASAHLAPLLTGDNVTVSVTYASESLINASFESLNLSSQIRLDLPAGFGVYGRVNWMDNNAPAEVLVQTLTDVVGGVDYSWRWLRAGAEYENYDSNFSRYQATRLYENFNFRLDQRSSLSFNLSETYYHYPNNGDQTQYLFLTRYHTRLWQGISWYVEGGCSYQKILGTDHLQGSARTGLSWTRGKLSLRAGYEFNAQSTSGTFQEERDKHRLFVYLKRMF